MKKLSMVFIAYMMSVLLGSVTQTVFCADIIVDSYTKANLPAVGTAGRLARVTDDSRGPWMDNGDAWVNLNADRVPAGLFGISTSNPDNGPAITTALAVLGGKVLVFPSGIFDVTTTINGTLLSNRTIIGAGLNATTIRGRITAPVAGGPIFDLSGTTVWTFKDISISGQDPPNAPSTNILFSRTTDYYNSAHHLFINVALGGYTTKAGLVHSGTEQTGYYHTDIATSNPAGYAFYFGSDAGGDLGITSPYKTLVSSDSNNNLIIGGTISNAGTPQTVATAWLHNSNGVAFYRTYFNHQIPAGSTVPVIRLSGQSYNLTLDGTHVEGSAPIFLGFDANANAIGLEMRNHENSTSGTTTIVDATAAGSTINGMTLTNAPYASQTNAIKARSLTGSYIRAFGSNINITTTAEGNIFHQVGTISLPAGQTHNLVVSGNKLGLYSDMGTYANAYDATYKSAVDLNFGTIAARSVKAVSTTVTGVTTTNNVAVTATPASTVPANLMWSAFVSANDTVTVRMLNPTASSIVVNTVSFVIEAHKY